MANLQKTQDIVRIELGGLRHQLARARMELTLHNDSSHFFPAKRELFSGSQGLIGRPTHDRRVALRQTCRFP